MHTVHGSAHPTVQRPALRSPKEWTPRGKPEGTRFAHLRIPMDGELHEVEAQRPILQQLDHVPLVLAVDDEEDFLELTELFLGGAGIRVVKARSATEALWHAMATPPDLIFLDLMLPHVDGFQVLH